MLCTTGSFDLTRPPFLVASFLMNVIELGKYLVYYKNVLLKRL